MVGNHTRDFKIARVLFKITVVISDQNSRFSRCRHLTTTARTPFVFLYHLNFYIPSGV